MARKTTAAATTTATTTAQNQPVKKIHKITL
jgi:hypothetical protein